MNRRILVTGATGETGRYTTDLLISQGFKVRALVHKADERSEKLRARGADVVVGNLLDFDAVRCSSTQSGSPVFCAAISPRWMRHLKRLAQMNLVPDHPIKS